MLVPWFLMNRILDTFCAYLCFASVCVFWIVWMKCYCEKKLIVEDKCVLFLCVIEKRDFLFLFLFLCFQIKSCSIEWRIKTEDDRLIKCYLWFIVKDKTFQAKKNSRVCKKDEKIWIQGVETMLRRQELASRDLEITNHDLVRLIHIKFCQKTNN